MRLNGSAKRVTVLIGEDDTWHHRPLHSEIVHRAHVAGMAGASVFRGLEGYGVSSHVHTSRILSLTGDLPIAVVVIDTEDKIEVFVRQLDELLTDGLVVVDDVWVHRYPGRDGPR